MCVFYSVLVLVCVFVILGSQSWSWVLSPESWMGIVWLALNAGCLVAYSPNVYKSFLNVFKLLLDIFRSSSSGSSCSLQCGSRNAKLEKSGKLRGENTWDGSGYLEGGALSHTQNQKGTILTCQREFMFTATGQLSKAAPASCSFLVSGVCVCVCVCASVCFGLCLYLCGSGSKCFTVSPVGSAFVLS